MTAYRGYPAGYYDDNDEDDYDFTEMCNPTESNLKITVIPNISEGAGIDGQDFDANLGEEMQAWFLTYQSMWNAYKGTPSMNQSLKSVYVRDENPMLLALKLFANCPGCNNLKNKNLALYVLESICALHRTHPQIANTCTDNMRMVAFNFVKTSGVISLYNGITIAYQLFKIKGLLVTKIQELIDQKRYKDAAYWAINLNVTQSFNIYQIVLPLILQAKTSLAIECLDMAKDQQEEMVQYLDSVLDKRKTVIDHCYPIIQQYGYNELNHSVITFRPMSKLVARLAKKYNIEAQLTPNLSYTKSRSYMYYLYKRFRDGGMSRDSFRELVRDAATTPTLKYDLVSNIASHGDQEEALYWVRLYQIPTEQWPANLADDGAGNMSGNDAVDGGWASEASPNNSGDASPSNLEEDYLQLELRDEAIILVDTRASFIEMVNVLDKQSLIAFDSEWKPSACQVETVSLLQMATCDKVFLIDVTAEEVTDDLWKLLGRNVFNNLEILKIGFALRQDMSMLQKSVPQMNLCLASASCYLDLTDMWNRLKDIQSFTFPYKRGSSIGTGLSGLAEICLGKKIDKSNQLSNWAKRPLRRDQIIYAALDAYCLIQIYKVIVESLTRLGCDIDELVDEITSSNSTKPDKLATKLESSSSRSSRTSRTSRLPQKALENAYSYTYISSTDIKFFCDAMLGGLLHNLRRLGVDCLEINLRTNMDHYVQKALEDHRYVLSRDVRFDEFYKVLPHYLCVEVADDSVDSQVVKVLQHFNIAVNKECILSRCPTCNGDEFISASRHQMQMMKFGASPSNMSYATTMASSSQNWPKPIKYVFASKPVTEEIIQTGRTFSSANIKLNKLSSKTVFSQTMFYICDKCGRVTWPDDYRMGPKTRAHVLAE